MKPSVRTVFFLALAVAATGCGDREGPGAVSTRVRGITITPDSVALIPGGTQLFTAELRDGQGNVVTGRMLRWTVANPSVARIDSLSGEMTALATGVTTVRALSELQTATAKVVVLPEPVAGVTVSPDSTEIRVGGATTFTAAAVDGGGGVITGRPATWASSDPNIATVNPTTGEVMGVAPGRATITGTVEGISDDAVIKVSKIPVGSVVVTPDPAEVRLGGTTALTASVTDSAGTVVTDRNVIWSSADLGIATVGPQGTVAGVSLGSTTVIGASEGKADTVVVNVTALPVGSVTVNPASLSFGAFGDTATLQAAVKDSVGADMPAEPVSWTSSDESVATVTGAGLVTAIANGTATITATAGGVDATPVDVSVAQVVSSVVVTGGPVSLTSLGETRDLTAEARDVNDNPIAGATITWASGDANVATVSTPGATATVTAVANGTTAVTASSDGVDSAPVAVNVSQGAATVTVTPAGPVSFHALGDTLTLTATVFDALGQEIAGASVSWGSDTPGVATVDATTGLVTTVANGSATMTVTSGAATADVTVSVQQVAAAVEITPAGPLSFDRLGASDTLTATVRDANGVVISGATVTWVYPPTSLPIAEIASTANTTTLRTSGNGSATITASSGTAADTVSVTVQQVVAKVEVTGGPVTLASIGATQDLTARALDGNDNPVAAATISWASGNVNVATVTTPGATTTVTAAANGSTTVAATSDGVDSAPVDVTVTQAAASVTASPDPVDIRVNGTRTLGVTVRDGGGAEITGLSPTFASGDANVATVDGAGLVTGVAVGSTSVVVEVDGVADTVAVNVTAIPVGSVTLPAGPIQIREGGTTQLTATVVDSAGTTVTDRPITWTGTDDTVATVDQTGIVTGVLAGAMEVIAEAEGRADTVAITVSPVPVASVAVSPDTATIPLGGGMTLAATVTDSLGNVVTGRTVTWSSASAATATVDPASGLVRGRARGSVEISAEVEGVTGSAQVSVDPGVVFASDRSTPTRGRGVWVMNQDGTRPYQLTAGGTLSDDGPIYSPDGSRIAFSRGGLAPGTPVELWIMDADGSNPTQLTSNGAVNAGPSFSPSGDTIAFHSSQDADFELYLIATAGGSSTQITTNSDSDVEASFSPDGTHLVFTSDRDGDSEIYSIDLRNRVTTRLTGSSGTDQSPVYSPDGSTIAYASQQGSPLSQIYLMDADGDNKRSLTFGPAPNGNYKPRYSGDGSRILFQSIRDGDFEVYVMNSDGTVQTRLTDSPGQDAPGGFNTLGETVPPKIASIRMTPPGPLSFATLGRTATITGEALNGVGNVVSGKTLTWSSSQPGVATVAVDGTVTAVGNGTTEITASVDGVTSDPVRVDVSQVVTSIDVSPAGPLTLTSINEAASLTATPRDSLGNAITYPLTVGWLSSDASVATVDSAGTVTAVANGSTEVLASVGLVLSQPVQVTVQQAVTRVVLSRDSLTLYIDGGSRGSVTADPQDALGNTVAGKTVAYQLSDSSVATVAGLGPRLGVLFGVKPGYVNLTGSVDGVTSAPTLVYVPPRIVFASRRDNPTEDIFTMNRDGSNTLNLSAPRGGEGFRDTYPQYSADGSRILFTSDRSGKDEIWEMDANGANPRMVTNTSSGSASKAHYSPSGDSIVYVVAAPRGPGQTPTDSDVWIIARDGTGARRVDNTNVLDTDPEYSPLDGTRLVFSSQRNPPGTDIYVMDTDGLNLTRLTTASAGEVNVNPAWSPDASEIVFVSNRGGRANVYIMDSTGESSGLQNLTSGETFIIAGNPHFSTDGAFIVFSGLSVSTGSEEIFLMRADGSDLAVVGANPAGDYDASFEPDPPRPINP